MSEVNNAAAPAAVAVPDSLLASISRVLDNAQHALTQHRETIAALNDVNTRLMLGCLERDRTIHELRADVQRLLGDCDPLEEKAA